MSLGRSNSQVNLYSPFLLKFQGKVGQITKKGTLLSQPGGSNSSNLRLELKNTRSTMLTEKRANNILLDLNQIKDKNAEGLESITHHNENNKHHKNLLSSVSENINPSLLGQSVLINGCLSNDFKQMLLQLNNIQKSKRAK